MAFTYHGIVPGRTGTLHETETINYLFQSDDKNDEAVTLFQHPDCPRYWSKHPQYRWMFCAALSYQQMADKEWSKWVVSAEYKPIPREKWPTGEPSPRQPPTRTDPNAPPDLGLDDDEEVDFLPHIRMSFEEFAVPCRTAYSATEAATRAFGIAIKGNYAIVKSNLEPYDPAPEKLENNLIIDIQRNVDMQDGKIWKQLENLRNSTNTKSLNAVDLGVRIPAHCARFRYSTGPKVEYTNQKGKESVYRALNVQLVVRWDTWKFRGKDDGSYAFSVAGTKTIQDRFDTADWDFPVGAVAEPFYDQDDNRIIKLLDGKGNELSSADPVVNEYTIYRTNDMRAFLHYLTLGDIV